MLSFHLALMSSLSERKQGDVADDDFGFSALLVPKRSECFSDFKSAFAALKVVN
jgi:hypothetical protein